MVTPKQKSLFCYIFTPKQKSLIFLYLYHKVEISKSFYIFISKYKYISHFIKKYSFLIFSQNLNVLYIPSKSRSFSTFHSISFLLIFTKTKIFEFFFYIHLKIGISKILFIYNILDP